MGTYHYLDELARRDAMRQGKRMENLTTSINTLTIVVTVATVVGVLLTAGVLSVITDAIITSFRARNARKKELLGLLRMLYVEIEVNRGEAELLLSAKNPKAGPWTDTIYEDDTWKEVRSRLSQLLPDADHFNQLVAYYTRNNAQEKAILDVIARGASFRTPGDAQAKLMANLIRQQEGFAVDALEMIKGHIGDPPVARESVEEAAQEMEQLQRELDAEKERRELEEQ